MGDPERLPPSDQELHKPKTLLELEERWSLHNTLVCVGLDSDYSKLPDEFKAYDRSIAQAVFNREIVRPIAKYACAFKANMAFYEELGEYGLQALRDTISFIHAHHPGIPVIFDGKKGDIGNTNSGYKRAAFDDLKADAITVAPYLGSSMLDKDGERRLGSLEPFLSERDKLIFVLCRTSNEDAGELQDLPIALNGLSGEYRARFGNLDDLADRIGSNTAPLYLVLAHKLARDWNKYGNVGLVVGATYPEEMAQIRRVVGDMPILMPGLGAQEGDARSSIQGGIDSGRQGLVVNSSRGIIFASHGEDYAEAAKVATKSLRDQINQYRRAA